MPPRRDSFRRNRVAPLTILFYRFRTTLVRAARKASAARLVTIHGVALHQVEHFGLRSSRRRGLRLGFLPPEAAVACKAAALLPEPTISRTAAASQSRITTLLWQQNRPCTSCSRENSWKKLPADNDVPSHRKNTDQRRHACGVHTVVFASLLRISLPALTPAAQSVPGAPR